MNEIEQVKVDTNPNTKNIDIPNYYMAQIRTLNFHGNIITLMGSSPVYLECITQKNNNRNDRRMRRRKTQRKAH